MHQNLQGKPGTIGESIIKVKDIKKKFVLLKGGNSSGDGQY